MDMRRLKTIAICFSLTVATLASQDVSAEPAKKYDAMRTFLVARKAFGAKAFLNDLTADDRTAILTCASLQSCADHFGGKLGPDNLAAVRAKVGI
jgi:hypothetical protein